MSSFNRRHLFLASVASLFALAACGFTPVYGPQGSATNLRGAIEVQEPRNSNAYHFVKHFEERMGLPQSPRYELAYSISTRSDGVAVTPSQATTRYNLIGEINYTLREIGTGATVTSGRVQNFTSYGSTGFTISTQTSRDDAYRRLMVILADDIIDNLLIDPEVAAP